MMIRCPYCGGTNVDADVVDVGVGMMRSGPYGCEDCHACEMMFDDPEATDEERRVGWYRATLPKKENIQ